MDDLGKMNPPRLLNGQRQYERVLKVAITCPRDEETLLVMEPRTVS
jgi:hypothetical protein